MAKNNPDEETLRFPTNLDRAGIEARLIEVRENARRYGLVEIVRLFENLSAKTSQQIGANVVAALNKLQDKPGHRPLTHQLEMVAMNLKNLK
jgi:hypothetical protein